VLAGAPGFGRASAQTEQQCFTDWSDAAPVVARERLKPARAVQGAVRDQLGGDVVRITLCREGDGFVYRVVVRGLDGRISNMRLSAVEAPE
jgi:hypothetical protein